MKLILLISILFTTYLGAATQIVIGTFSKSSSAISVKDELNGVINKDVELKSFLDKNNIKSVTKQDGKFFIVTLEPILDKKTQTHLLSKIRSTQFKDAYILKLAQENVQTPQETAPAKEKTKPIKEVKSEPAKEAKPEPVKDVKKQQIEEITPVVVKEKPAQEEIKKVEVPQQVQENFVQKYMIEIIASILILVLVVAYMFVIKSRQKKPQDDMEEDIIIQDSVDDYESYAEDTELENTVDEYEDVSSEQEEFIVKEDEFLSEQEETEAKEAEAEIEEDQEKETEVEEEVQTKEESTKEIDPLRSSIEKKSVPPHGKISKDNFKEFEGMRIMIAEDNLINQKVIKGLLSESGINITIVDDGEEAINHLKTDDAFCMILMDVNMPNMDGFEATRIIRSKPEYSHITVIALSGDVAADDIANMRASGMQENLEKPLKMDALYDILYAYGYHREDKIDIDKNELKDSESKELDTEAGIELCGGDEGFYKEILNDFLNSYEGSTKTIQDFLNNNERKAAQQILLDITGITANIGANNIQELINSLKQELKDPEGKEYINTFKKYAAHFEALENEVKEYLS